MRVVSEVARIVTKGAIAGAVACGVLAAAPAVAAPATWELHLPGVSHHFGKPKVPGRSYNEFHDGLGLQRTEVRPSYVLRYSAGFMRDSFDKQGGYVGGSIGVRVIDGAYSVDLTAAPMLLYRTTGFTRTDRKFIPILLPMVSFEHKATGLGANLTVLPAGNFGKDMRFPGLVYLQFTYRLQ